MAKCLYGDIWFCEECDKSEGSFFCMCNNEEIFKNAACACPECSKGIINPTIHMTMACDQCKFEEPISKIIKRLKYKKLAFLIKS